MPDRSVPPADAVAKLAAAYGPPSQAAFGSAVFNESVASDQALGEAAQAVYRNFVGDLWSRYGEDAWLGPWRELYARPAHAEADVVDELRGLNDTVAMYAAEMVLDNDSAALAAVFDDPKLTELRIFNIGDGEAMSGLLVAGRRRDQEEAVFLVFLMD